MGGVVGGMERIGVYSGRMSLAGLLGDGVTAVSPAVTQYHRHGNALRRRQESLKCADNESKWLELDTNNK